MKAILTYHSIDDSGSPISVPAPVFRRHVEWLAARGPRVVTVDELLGQRGTEPAVAITFDDAFESFADIAWPLLREYGLPVTLFVPTAHVGGTNEWGGIGQRGIPVLRVLGWDRIARLANEGVIIGSHTRSHPRLDRLPAAAIHDELEGSAVGIEARIGARPTGLAYPYGAHDARVTDAAARTYAWACTTELRPLGPADEPHRLPRLDAYYFRSAGTLEAWGRTRLKLYVRARAGVRRCRELFAAASGR